MPNRDVIIDEYLKHGNAKRAAAAAGYSNPQQQGSRLLQTPFVKEALCKAITPVMKERAATVENLTDRAFTAHDRSDARASEQIKALEFVAKLHRLMEPDTAKTAPTFNVTFKLEQPNVSRETHTLTIEHDDDC